MSKIMAPVEINKDYIYFLDVNGLSGRHIKLPSVGASRDRIVVLGGFLSSAEKHFGLLEYLRSFGEVNYIDLPGYGGMDSLYSIDEFPMNDNFGDYLFSVLKTIKLNKDLKIICLGSSINFIANLLNRHPISNKWIDKIISIDGIDAEISQANYEGVNKWLGRSLMKFANSKITVNRLLYKRLIGSTEGVKLSNDERDLLDHLLSNNDIRTHVTVMNEVYNSNSDPTKFRGDKKRNLYFIQLDAAYKNFKLYDKKSISELLPAQIESILT